MTQSIPTALVVLALITACGNNSAQELDRRNAEIAAAIMDESAERLARWSPKLDSAMAIILAEAPHATDDELRAMLLEEGFTPVEADDILRYRGLLAGIDATDPAVGDTIVAAYLERGRYAAAEINEVIARRRAERR